MKKMAFFLLLFLLAGCTLVVETREPTATAAGTNPAPTETPDVTRLPGILPAPEHRLRGSEAILARIPTDGYGEDVCFSPTGETLAVSGGAGTRMIRLDLSFTPETTWTAPEHGLLTFSPDGSRLAVTSGTVIYVLDAMTGARVAEYHPPYAELSAVAFSPGDGDLLVVNAHNLEYTSEMVLWSAASGAQIDYQHNNDRWSTRAVISPDAQAVAVGTNWLSYWEFGTDTVTGLCNSTMCAFPRTFAFSPGGNRLAADSSVLGNYIFLHSRDEHTAPMVLDCYAGPVNSLVFSLDDALLAAGCGSSVLLWDAASGRHVLTMTDRTDPMRKLSYSPDGSILAALGHYTVFLWDVSDAKGLVADAAALAPAATPVPRPSYRPYPGAQVPPPLLPGQAVTITEAHMWDAQHGWAMDASGHLLRMHEEDENWVDITPSADVYTSNGIHLSANGYGWATPSDDDSSGAVTTAIVWRIVDPGGYTYWEPSRPIPLDENNAGVLYYRPRAIVFLDDDRTGWLLAEIGHASRSPEHRLFRTLDGGVTWETTPASVPGPSLCAALDIAFLDMQEGWLAGNCMDEGNPGGPSGYIYHTMSGGLSWDLVNLPAPRLPAGVDQAEILCGPVAVDLGPVDILAVTIDCRQPGNNAPLTFYFRSLDRGQTWRSWQLEGGIDFLADGLTGWQFAIPGPGQSNQLQQTTDGGQTWSTVRTVAWPQARIDFIDPLHGWAVVFGDGAYALVRTTDGGATWIDVEPEIYLGW